MLIRNALVQIRDKNILALNDDIMDSLDENDQILFSKILTYPIKSSSKIGGWTKLSNNTYKVQLDDTNSLIFTYDKENYTFDCDESDEFCKEFNQ